MTIEFEKIKYLSELSIINFDGYLKSEFNGLIQINSVNKHKISDTISLFSTHEKIQTEITKSYAVEGYSELLLSLEKVFLKDDFDILQINIVTENCGYLFFTDLKLTQLFGVLKMNKQKLNRKIELNEFNELKGSWTDKKFYFEGKALN